MRVLVLVTVLVARSPPSPSPSRAAMDPANPITSSLKGNYERVKKFITSAADEMPPAEYAFKPTPDVRSFAQLIGHVADAQYMFCGAAKKEGKPNRASIEKTVTTKDALEEGARRRVRLLRRRLRRVDGRDAVDANRALRQDKMIKFHALDINVAHDNEHYGNIVTYLRLKKLVPPSSHVALVSVSPSDMTHARPRTSARASRNDSSHAPPAPPRSLVAALHGCVLGGASCGQAVGWRSL